MVYFRIFLYNIISVLTIFAMITTTLVQGRLLFDDPDIITKVARVFIQILIPNLIYAATIMYSRDWMRQLINSKLTFQAEGNGINVDSKYDNGILKREVFEQLPRLVDEEVLRSWADNWLHGQFDDFGIKFWIDEIDYASLIYKQSDRSKVKEVFSLPDKALIIEFDQQDIFGDDWIVWLNSSKTSRAIELTNYQHYHKLELDSKSKGQLFFEDQSLIGDASLLQLQLEQSMDIIFPAEAIMFKQNTMILYANNPGNIKLSLPFILTPSGYHAAVNRQQANIYKMCQLLITMSKLS